MSDLYEYLNAKKGKAYFEDQIKPFSLISLYPEIDTSRKLRGNSRTGGDADKEIQDTIIDMLITISSRYGLTYKEISYILLMTKVESGFNPDAAAGTTSAAGLVQGTVEFIKDALTQSESILGFTLDLRNEAVFDAENGCYAVIYSFLLNKSKVMDVYTPEQSEYWEWIYLLHHDGVYSLGKYLNGSHKKSKDGQKWSSYIIERLSTVESILKNTEVSTKFKLSTGDNTSVKNKNYIAAISPFPVSICPNFVSDYEKPLILIKGLTDSNGLTEPVNAITGSEVVFTILSDNYKELAKIPSQKETSEATKPTVYTVKKGDTLSVIAKRYGVSVEKIARINKIYNINMLSIGAKLKIPDAMTNHGYVSRYVSDKTKSNILESIGVESANVKAAVEYSRSHIILPKGSKSADSEKGSNVIHIKTTTTDKSVSRRSKNDPEEHQTTSEGKAKNVSVDNDFAPVIIFSSKIPEDLQKLVSSQSLDIMKEIMKSSGVHKVTISSTLRTVQKQVDAMYVNMCSKGIQSQFDYYAGPGREVVQAGVDAGGTDKSKENAVKKAMIDKVKSLQKDGRFVSKHCVSLEAYAIRNVFDMSKNSLPASLQHAFDRALAKYVKDNPNKMKYISPLRTHGEPAFHVEIVQ